MDDCAVAGDRREVRLPAEGCMEAAQGRSRARAVVPRVLEPAFADFRVGPAGDPALRLEPAPRVTDINIDSSGTCISREPLANFRSFKIVRSEFKIAELDLKISSRKTISASGSMVSVLRV